jgi:hypothetical protein
MGMINPDNDAAIDGKLLEVLHERSEETFGNTVVETDQQVNHGADPSSSAFGLISSRVYNEKNSNKSRRRNRTINTASLVSAVDKAYTGLESIGADSITETRSYVELPAAAPDSGHLVVESNVKFLNSKNGLKTTQTVAAWQPRTSRNIADDAADGEATTTTKQVVQASDAWPTRTLNTLSLTREQLGDAKFLQVHKVADSRPVLVSSEEESTTGKKVTVTRSIHASAPSFADDGTPRFVKNVKHVGKDRWLQVVREIDDSILTTTFQEYHPVEYIFPAYLDETTPFLVFQAGYDQSLINSLRSASQRLRVPCLFETTYHSSLPTLSSIFQFKPVDIKLRTSDGVFDESNVITDGGIITFILKPTSQALAILGAQYQNNQITLQQYINTAMGNYVQFEFPPSSPTTTEYKALMGTVVLVADDMTRWKYNLYRRTKVWMKLPNLATDLSGSINYS